MERNLGTPERLPTAVGEADADEGPRGFGWRRLQVVAAIGAITSFLVPMVILLSFEAFLLAMAAPFVIGLLVMLRWPRAGAIWLGVVSLAVLLFSAPYLVDAFAHPESLADFLPLLVFAASALVGAAAAIPSFRQGARPGAPSRPARATAIVAVALIGAGAIVSVVAFAGVESVPARSGDIRLVTEDLLFQPVEIAAESGTVSVHVTNTDATRHTFTIDEVGVDLNIPPNATQRVSFQADPGTYRFYCRPHDPGMEGELVVG